MSVPLAGVRPLLKVSLHQDVRNVVPWVAIVTVLSATSILAYEWIFDEPEERVALARTLGANPALSLVFGPAKDLSTADGFNGWRAGQLGAFFTGLMAVLTVVRNSRANEDSGQAELIASGVIARTSRLAVAVAIASIASVALGVVCFLVTVLCGGGVASTAVLSASYTAAGLMFVGVATITAQLGADARAASTFGVATLGIAYVLRGYVDISDAPDWATWVTPYGWLEESGPGADNNPWPLLLALGLAIVLVAVGFALQERRDFGQGMVAQRPGPREAGVAGHVWGLALKLNASSLVGWLVAFAALGALFGTVATSVGELVAGNPGMGQVLTSGAEGPSDLTFAFVATILQIIAIIAATMGVQVALRIHAEEVDHRVEPLLAASLRRHTYLASNALVALAGTGAAMLVAGTALGVVAHARDSSTDVGDVVLQATATVPAVWILVSIAFAAVGARPAVRMLGWVGVVATFGLTILGPTFKLPDWALDISPLRHVPQVTATDPDWSALGWLGLVILTFLAIAFAGFRRRDLM
ncbi:ABC transporter permease [Nocardioides jishulii]|uniref:Multidrug ABC transporter permease n=1 Tax=Nocardioides jishulii TaxID=2575440 RepID=A0A4U2YTI5_9ACTN|nr:multidrug ABC transporter permease [Nocardioides jishulii]QCX28944.1 multidrug ABC transporter permease [Nocardioides jishulii]TKI64155.1 multidrug ABC transporter permease [Nocardioides jishulii]